MFVVMLVDTQAPELMYSYNLLCSYRSCCLEELSVHPKYG